MNDLRMPSSQHQGSIPRELEPSSRAAVVAVDLPPLLAPIVTPEQKLAVQEQIGLTHSYSRLVQSTQRALADGQVATIAETSSAIADGFVLRQQARDGGWLLPEFDAQLSALTIDFLASVMEVAEVSNDTIVATVETVPGRRRPATWLERLKLWWASSW